MVQKGIEKELALRVVAEREDNPKDVIAKLIENKYYRYLTDEKGFIKVYNALVRKGFSYSDVRCVLDTYKNSDY